MEKTIEAHVAEYIYERLVKLAMPVTQMPLTFQGFTAPLERIFIKPMSAILPFDRPEFQQVIQLLLGLEVHTKPNSMKSDKLIATPLSRRSYSDAIREHNQKYAGLCRNHTRLCELFDLLMYRPDDFIGYLRLTVNNIIYINDHREHCIEFAIGLAGVDLMNSSGKKMPAYERKLVKADWERHCADHHYFTDFSLLLDQAQANGIIYLIDHTTFPS
jgi:hypothetical protein